MLDLAVLLVRFHLSLAGLVVVLSNTGPMVYASEVAIEVGVDIGVPEVASSIDNRRESDCIESTSCII